MTEKLFFLYNGETHRLKRVTAQNVQVLLTLSILSLTAKRHSAAQKHVRERSTVPIGILKNVVPVGIIIEKTILHITGPQWLVILELSFDGNAETPSVATPPISPVPPTLCASGIYKVPF